MDEQKLFVEIMSKGRVQKYIVKLNVDQMRVDFMNSDGVQLSEIGGGYSDYTMSRGKKKGRDKVDLHDTGEFHDSFKIVGITGDQFIIDSDPDKGGGTNLLVEWGREIEGLTFENMQATGNFMLGFYKEKILTYLLG